MSPSTHVFVLQSGEVARLRKRLNDAGFEFRSLQHATFQARGEGVVASMYRSGKLVVQGKGAEAWCQEYLGDQGKKATTKSKASTSPAADLDPSDSIGSDEAGKGDSFGGLVVCAVAIPSDSMEELRASRVADSKSLNDDLIRTLAPWIAERFPHEVRALMPEEYNRAWVESGRNVNRLLTRLHVEAVAGLIERTGFRKVVVDRFAAQEPVSAALRSKYAELSLTEVPRAEAHLAVAAASVLARERFLSDLKKLSEHWALELPLGSGSPVPPALKRFHRLHGADPLHKVAKVHFKNVQSTLY